jgi:glycine/D-amino acid oxidase-like deaminating enzyme/nitrite reductase/ring-hydroxylating ferredoxin subunit
MENTQSYWLASTPETDYPGLASDITVDVAVLGGGLAGLSIAWLLKQEGLRVAVVEANRICQGVSGHTTAKITSQHDLVYAELDQVFGRERARQYADANEAALKLIGETIKTQGIDCDYEEKAAYVFTEQDQYVAQIEKEGRIAAELGLPAQADPEPGLPFPVKAALRFDKQAQFHPRKYALALARTIPGAGCALYEQSPVVGLEEGKIITITTKGGPTIRADVGVLATHFPCHDGGGLYFSRMYAERSYVLGVRAESPLPAGMYISAEQPGRSLRTQGTPEGDLLLVGGEHHRTGTGKEWPHYQKLEDYARDHFKVAHIPYRWSAQDYTSADKIPYIGYLKKGKDNLFVATGFRKWGMTTSAVAAMLIRDLIVWGSNPWQDVYSPQRGMGLKAAGKTAGMNVEVAAELITGKLAKAGPSKSGEAWVESRRGKKIGYYRDPQGEIHRVDLTCTHLGCEVAWNSAEKTWDCPCHGSRFTPDGEIISGPALKPLGRDIDPDIV